MTRTRWDAIAEEMDYAKAARDPEPQDELEGDVIHYRPSDTYTYLNTYLSSTVPLRADVSSYVEICSGPLFAIAVDLKELCEERVAFGSGFDDRVTAKFIILSGMPRNLGPGAEIKLTIRDRDKVSVFKMWMTSVLKNRDAFGMTRSEVTARGALVQTLTTG